MPAAWVAGAGMVANIGMSIIGGNRSAAAAAEQARAQNRAMMARYQYDLNMWDMKRSQLQAQRMEAVDNIILQAKNEGKIRAYKDAQAAQQYEYALQIRNSQQASNEAAFERSENIYTKQSDLNFMAAKAAMESNIVQLEETRHEQSFDKNDAYIEMLQAEGALRARGASGRSADKTVQTTMADYGKQIEMLEASYDSAGRNTRGVLEDIIRDKSSADLTAYAQRMLDPGVLPMPIKQAPIPVPEFTLPRVLQDYDFGPQPVKGAMASPGAAAQAVWGQTLTNIGAAIGTGATGIAAGLG
tara:strand:- start:4363 stop:5262 length:900 start_codon:yes stop_codon:yes gene_type:complete